MTHFRQSTQHQLPAYQYAYGNKTASGVCLQNVTDYSPFGVTLDGRTMQGDGYRYSFQGQEHDDEVKGEGNSVNYKYRLHDPRVGRFFAVDPITAEYAELTSYQFSSNSPILNIELEGLEGGNSNTLLQNSYIGIGFRLNISQPKGFLKLDNKIDYDSKYLEKLNRINLQPQLTLGINKSIDLFKGVSYLGQKDFLNTNYNLQAKATLGFNDKVQLRWGVKSNLDINSPLDVFSGEYYFGSERNEFQFSNPSGQSIFNNQKNRVAYNIAKTKNNNKLPTPNMFGIVSDLSQPVETFEEKATPFKLKLDYKNSVYQNKYYNFFSNSKNESIVEPKKN